jgi:hypothetical protein
MPVETHPVAEELASGKEAHITPYEPPRRK